MIIVSIDGMQVFRAVGLNEVNETISSTPVTKVNTVVYKRNLNIFYFNNKIGYNERLKLH